MKRVILVHAFVLGLALAAFAAHGQPQTAQGAQPRGVQSDRSPAPSGRLGDSAPGNERVGQGNGYQPGTNPFSKGTGANNWYSSRHGSWTQGGTSSDRGGASRDRNGTLRDRNGTSRDRNGAAPVSR